MKNKNKFGKTEIKQWKLSRNQSDSILLRDNSKNILPGFKENFEKKDDISLYLILFERQMKPRVTCKDLYFEIGSYFRLGLRKWMLTHSKKYKN